MTDAIASTHSLRSEPRLWVETLWILDSLEAIKPLREIPLSLGLNLILSEPLNGSTGHGVGKTAFCQLLRYALEDPQWATGTPLRDELLHSFPEGAVAARVHVDGEIWTVVKPWRHQRQYRAAKDADWQALARDEVPNEHEAYVAALNRKLVDILPVKKLPGSGQSIQWQHILAWCSRDQECRYLGYYRWRTEGAGFSLPAQSPALMVKVVLGLLDDASVHHRLKQLETQLGKTQEVVAELKLRPNALLAHVKHQLATALGQPDGSPFRSLDLFKVESLQGLARQKVEGYTEELRLLGEQQLQIESEREQLLVQRAPLAQRTRALENSIQQIQAAISGNVDEVERLKKEPESLQAHFSNQCDLGDRLVSNCQYVVERVETLSLNSVRNVAIRTKEVGKWQQSLTRLRGVMGVIEQEMRPLSDRLTSSVRSLEEAKSHAVAALAACRRLEEALAEYELYEGIISGNSEWPELKQHEDELQEFQKERDRLLLQFRQQTGKYTDRRKTIESALDSLAKQLPGFSWAILRENESRPFRMGPPHSAALAVLETLVGDFVCLADSRYQESFHPGFLLHDSPREAEMSDPVFWKFLSVASGYGESIQYVVTTSTNAPEAFKKYVRLKLGNHRTSDLLFKERIGLEQQSLEG